MSKPKVETYQNDTWVEKLEPSYAVGAYYNGAATLEDSLAVSQKDERSYHMTQQFHSWL